MHWDRNEMVAILQTTFQIYFAVWKSVYLNSNLAVFSLLGSNSQYIIIVSGKGLVLNKRQGITCTNNDLVYFRIYALVS